MGFASFVGRFLFAAIFILSAWQEALSVVGLRFMFNEFGDDGGPLSKLWRPKFGVFKDNVSTHFGVQVPDIEIKHLVATAIVLKGIGGILFIFGSTLGAYLLAFQLIISTPVLYDFYNYDVEKTEFFHLFAKFVQNLAFFGALLFFLGMKNMIPRRQPKKKVIKSKTM